MDFEGDPRSFPSEWISFLQSIAAALDKHLTSFNESRHHPIATAPARFLRISWPAADDHLPTVLRDRAAMVC